MYFTKKVYQSPYNHCYSMPITCIFKNIIYTLFVKRWYCSQKNQHAYSDPIVRFRSQCKRTFGYIIFTSRPIKLNRSFQRFGRTLGRNFNWVLQQMKNFPMDPNVTIVRFRQRYYHVVNSGQFLQWGSTGKIVTRCRIWMKFCTRVCLKPSNDWGEFELDRAWSKYNIAENLFALGHETDNRLVMSVAPPNISHKTIQHQNYN